MERGVLVLVLAATLAACGGGGGDAGDAGSPEATPADGDMLIIGTPADFDTMFPPSSNSAQAGWAYGQSMATPKMRMNCCRISLLERRLLLSETACCWQLHCRSSRSRWVILSGKE